MNLIQTQATEFVEPQKISLARHFAKNKISDVEYADSMAVLDLITILANNHPETLGRVVRGNFAARSTADFVYAARESGMDIKNADFKNSLI